MKTITQEIRTLEYISVDCSIIDVEIETHGAAKTHLQEENRLLPMSQRTHVHGRQSSNCHGADRIEERVDVGYLDFAITCIKDS